MARTCRKELEKRALTLLAIITELEKTCGSPGVEIAKHEMAALLGVSEYQARFSARALAAAGLVSCEPQYAANGGCLANAYAVTPAGRHALRVGATGYFGCFS